MAVEVLNHAIEHPAEPWTSARPVGEVTEHVSRLLTGALSSGPATPDERARELIAALARELAEGLHDLVRVTAATEPGGHPLDDELHLLGRHLNGNTFRLSIAPSVPLPSSDGLWPDPSRVLAGEIAAPPTLTEGEYRQADLAVRANCAAALLGEFVWLTNNDRMKVDVKVQPHGLDLDFAAPGAVDATFRTWWPKSDHRAELVDDEWWEEDEAELRRLDGETLARVLTDFDEHNLEQARSGAWAMEEIDDYDIDDDPQPSFPGDRLVVLLGRDLFHTVTTQVAGGSGGVLPLAYGIGLPFEVSDEDYGFRACLLLVGTESVGIVTIDAAA
ncbi:hypothetical protein [Streptomyces sp. ME19-01-6]|uniref:hypothetical protein n=1 Tax=Streptomyces sp. ME19-01-6 TaxID=3028686 RepID=UPI0029B07181|nr:hypothetical protein [Streptomyces sp. ME19-01-6]MDX3224782.1 hypothetical protein [Streptomyces sp. ME19-01-6]